jgi:AcrR family transcriptional regulator
MAVQKKAGKRAPAKKPRRFKERVSIDIKLLRAMEQLLANGESFSTVSIDRLSELAGIARATFYLHFRDKAELVAHLVEQVQREIVSAAGRWFEDASTTTKDDMARTLRGIIGTYREHHVILSAMAQTAATNDEVAALSRKMREQLCAQSRKAVRELREAGLAHPDADDRVAEVLTLAIDHVATFNPELLGEKAFAATVNTWTHIAWTALARPRV